MSPLTPVTYVSNGSGPGAVGSYQPGTPTSNTPSAPDPNTTPAPTQNIAQGSGQANALGWYTAPSGTPVANTTSSPNGNPSPMAADTLGTGATAITVPPTAGIPTTPPPVPSGTILQPNGTVTPTLPANPTGTPASGGTDAASLLRGILGEESTEGTVKAGLESAANIPGLTTAATNAANAYNQARVGQNTQVQAIQSRTDIPQAAKDAMIADVNDRSNATISNLSIESSIASGNLKDAQDTITQKINDQFGPLKDEASMIQDIATDENNDLTESQKLEITQAGTQLEKDNTLAQDAATTAHTTLLNSGTATAKDYNQLDQITADYKASKITASQAQTQYDEAAQPFAKDTNTTQHEVKNADGSTSIVTLDSKGTPISTTNIGGGTGGSLTTTELSTGAVRAGLDEKTFANLSPDVQAYFAHSTEATINAWDTMIDGVTDSGSAQTAIDTINKSNDTQAVKDWMTAQVNAKVPPSTNSGGGFFSKLWANITGQGNTDLFTGKDNNASAPAKGTTTTINGQPYVSDGTQWVLNK